MQYFDIDSTKHWLFVTFLARNVNFIFIFYMTFSLLVIKTILQGGTRKLLNTMFSIGAVVVDMEAAITENLIWQTFT